MHPHLSPPPADTVWRSQSFNVGTAGAKIFSGPAAEEFGYTVQQTTNHEGKWYEFKLRINDLLQGKKMTFSASVSVLSICSTLVSPKWIPVSHSFHERFFGLGLGLGVRE